MQQQNPVTPERLAGIKAGLSADPAASRALHLLVLASSAFKIGKRALFGGFWGYAANVVLNKFILSMGYEDHSGHGFQKAALSLTALGMAVGVGTLFVPLRIGVSRAPANRKPAPAQRPG